RRPPRRRASLYVPPRARRRCRGKAAPRPRAPPPRGAPPPLRCAPPPAASPARPRSTRRAADPTRAPPPGRRSGPPSGPSPQVGPGHQRRAAHRDRELPLAALLAQRHLLGVAAGRRQRGQQRRHLAGDDDRAVAAPGQPAARDLPRAPRPPRGPPGAPVAGAAPPPLDQDAVLHAVAAAATRRPAARHPPA